MDLLDSMDEKKSTSIRQEDISGDQHTFHSLPKEFQAWHNTQYMMEKKMDIDESTIPESLLNAYMWKTIGDAAKYGIWTFIFIVGCIIELKFNPTILGLVFAFMIYVPFLSYLVYHFVFYAKIRAQVVGVVTKNAAQSTTFTFYHTFGAIVGSLLIAFIFVFSILEDIATLFYNLASKIPAGSTGMESWLRSTFVSIYNFFVDILTGPDDLIGKLIFNTYFSVILFAAITGAAIFYFEEEVYKKRRQLVDEEMASEELAKGYPADAAMKKIKKWREDNEQ
jgi:hypothetical protein